MKRFVLYEFPTISTAQGHKLQIPSLYKDLVVIYREKD